MRERERERGYVEKETREGLVALSYIVLLNSYGRANVGELPENVSHKGDALLLQFLKSLPMKKERKRNFDIDLQEISSN